MLAALSKSSRSIAVACCEKTEKLTPPASGTAPRGWGTPGETARVPILFSAALSTCFGVMASFLPRPRDRTLSGDDGFMSYDYGVTLSSLRHWPVTTGKELLEAATHRPAGGVEITKGGRPLESAIDVDGESHLGAQNRRGPLQPHPDDA